MRKMRAFKISVISTIGVAAIYAFGAVTDVNEYIKRRQQMKRVRTD